VLAGPPVGEPLAPVIELVDVVDPVPSPCVGPVPSTTSPEHATATHPVIATTDAPAKRTARAIDEIVTAAEWHIHRAHARAARVNAI
jgi:hypothetical protein